MPKREEKVLRRKKEVWQIKDQKEKFEDKNVLEKILKLQSKGVHPLDSTTEVDEEKEKEEEEEEDEEE